VVSAREFDVVVGDTTTRAMYEPAESREHAVFVCGHGAGGNMHDRGMTATAAAMRRHGIGVVRFNFLPWRGRDPMPGLMRTLAAVVERVRADQAPSRLVIGGRSMGGRAASMLAADGYRADGLLLLAYPLHPAGQPEKLRDAHLPRIAMRVLCFSGTQDPLCTPALMNAALARVTAPWQMEWIEGADHSFHVRKSSGTTDAEVMERMGRTAGRWVTG
jgi:predicted alpha/beta-hydrolase family hydrolase